MMNCWSSFLSESVSLERSTFVSIVGGRWREGKLGGMGVLLFGNRWRIAQAWR